MLYSKLGILGRLTITSLLLANVCAASSIATAYCSSLNTGADNTAQQSIYQSQGLCSQTCQTDYAFAILLGKECWCSNFAPGVSTSTDDCSDECPGYPTDTCGNASDNLYEYLALNLVASGTQGASSASATASTSQITVTATPPPVTVTETTAPSPSPIPSSTSSTPSTSSTSTTSSASIPVVIIQSSSTTSDDTQSTTAAPTSTTANAISTSSTLRTTTSAPSSSSTWVPTPVTSIETVTNGRVMTVTITPTAPPNSVASDSLTDASRSGGGSALSGGQAAGLTIGLLAFLAIVSGIGYFCWRKRKQSKSSEYGGISRQGSTLIAGAGAAQPPSRTMSENSRYFLQSDGRAVYPAWENDEGQAGNRSSRLVAIDPRLDPHAGIYTQGFAGRRSHDSINTINDGHDYSRKVAPKAPVLRATNPDPDTPR